MFFENIWLRVWVKLILHENTGCLKKSKQSKLMVTQNMNINQ